MSRSLPISILLTLVLTAMGCAESTIDADGADEADDGPVTEASSAITTLTLSTMNMNSSLVFSAP